MSYANAKASLKVMFYLFDCIVALGKFEIWVQIGFKYLKSWCRGTHKIIQSLQLIISHQMMPYFSFTRFRVFGVLVQFGETGSKLGLNKYLKS